MKTMERIRRRRKEQKAQAQAKVEDERRLNQCLKAVNLNLQASPSAQVASLEIYIDKLREVREEMLEDYGNIRELVSIDVEVSRALEQLVRIKVDMVTPKEYA